MLTIRQTKKIINHLNARLRDVRGYKCSFCEVARELAEEHDLKNIPLSDENEMEKYCPHCPLQMRLNTTNCLDARKKHLRTRGDGLVTGYYDAATKKSIEKHVDWMMNKSNWFWELNLCWDLTKSEDNETVFNKGIKNEQNDEL